MAKILSFHASEFKDSDNFFQKNYRQFKDFWNSLDRFWKMSSLFFMLITVALIASYAEYLSLTQHASGSVCQGMSIAAYYGNANSPWWQMMATSYPATRMVVMENTSVSGPGSSVLPSLQSEIAQMKQANIRVFGYVYTSFGNRPVNSVETDIDAWRTLYGVTDIMFDEGPYAPGTTYIPFYQTITNYVHTKTPGSLVELNPAYPIDQNYLQFIDILSVYEGSYSAFLTFQFPSWMMNYPAAKFKAYIHSVPDSTVIPGLLQKVTQDNIGYFDITDATSSQIWGVLASNPFWNALVPDVKAVCNSGALPSPTTISTPTPSTQTANISLNPSSSSVSVGTPFPVTLTINGGNQALNAAQVTVSLPSNLSVLSLNPPSTNPCNFTYVSGHAPSAANPSFVGAILNGSSPNCNVYTLTLQCNSPGTGPISLTNGSVKSFTNNSEILGSLGSGSYVCIMPPSPVISLPPSATPTLAPSSTPIPTPTPSPLPTATPFPTATPIPTATPLPFPSPTPLAVVPPPSINPLPDKTYQQSITLSGTKDPSVVTIVVNNSSSGVTYPSVTSWTVTETLSMGNNTFQVFGQDSLGNQSTVVSANTNVHKLGDIDGDGHVDLTDLSLFAVDWGNSGSAISNPLSDMNGDLIIDLTDFSILAKLYGQ